MHKNYNLTPIPNQAFSPKSIAGLKGWYIPTSGLFQDSALTTPAVNTNDPIGAWVDISGQANNITQTTVGSKPALLNGAINGYNAVNFNGVSSFLSNSTFAGGSLIQPVTVFAVLKVATSAYSQLFDGISTNLSIIYNASSSGNTAGYVDQYAGTLAFYPNVFTVGSNFVFSSITNNASSNVSGNGVITSNLTTGTNTLNGFRMGINSDAVSFPLNGYIAEFLIYQAAPSAANRLQIENYLRYKYNVY
jgi:hypothetical protein